MRLLRILNRLSGKLYIGIGGAVSLTVAASLVGWFSFNRVGDAQNRVNEGSVPEMVSAFGMARYSSNLIAVAPNLTSVATTQEFTLVSSGIADTHRAFNAELADLALQTGADDERVRRARDHSDSLIANIREISTETFSLFSLARRSEALRTELLELRANLNGVLVPAIDDQLFYTVTGYRNLGEPRADAAEHFSAAEVNRYRLLAEVQAGGNEALQILSSAASVQDSASSIEPLRERFESAQGRIERALSAVEESEVRTEIVPLIDRLLELGTGPNNGFDLRGDELDIVELQRDLLARNREIAVELVALVDELVTTANMSTQESARASTQAIRTARTLLLAISIVSIAAALLIAWLFVSRVLLRRIQLLSSWMRQMADGDLEAQVEIGGRDEVAEMAEALEVFRNYALEVQRLNLVEKLAEELQEKNGQLENALGDLGRAQDQIVMREKLAALGELTAGVAHEVRNPLNFVKNFSEASEELLEELLEVLEEVSDEFEEEDAELIDEICDDLTANLGRIRAHGERANRIVHDMLMMGRGSTEWQSTDINNLVDEYSRLAYHSVRASNPEFQLDIKQEFDPDMGEVEVVPQNLSRVFLNMVGNACHATDERRNAGEEPGADVYVPTVVLKTKRTDDTCQISITDNGTGMPPEVVEKIFNPFFTTKPTGEGTGLGLALSNDIIREHGGTIRVRSEPGQFTEMTIELPLYPPDAVKEAASAGQSAGR